MPSTMIPKYGRSNSISAICPFSRCKLFLLLRLVALVGVEAPLLAIAEGEACGGLMLSRIEAGSSVMPTVGLKTGDDCPDSGNGEICGDAPRSPIIEGSLW